MIDNIFAYDFMNRAFMAGIAVAIVAPLIGSFLVVRRYSLMADTLAHVSLAGVAFGLLLNINPLISAIVTATLAAFGIERLRSSRKLPGESVLALFLTGSLAIATVLLSIGRGFNANLFSYLFGSIATVTQIDVYTIVGLSLVILLTVGFLYKELFFSSFDEELAETAGVPVKIVNAILIILAALTVSVSIRIVGVLLIGALMVIPVMTAMQLAKSFKQTVGYSVVVSLIAVVSGLFISYYFNLASGGTIVVIALAMFVISLFTKK
jgi:zinc transport system permease protein